MPKYRCSASVVGSKYLGEVEADSLEEAREKAEKLGTVFVSLCHQCSSEVQDPQIEDINVELCEDEEPS